MDTGSSSSAESEVDVLATPTAPIPAPRIQDKIVRVGGRSYPVRGPGSGSVSRNTSPSNSTGLPAISVPCGFTTAGLPIGLQLIGRPFGEAVTSSPIVELRLTFRAPPLVAIRYTTLLHRLHIGAVRIDRFGTFAAAAYGAPKENGACAHPMQSHRLTGSILTH